MDWLSIAWMVVAYIGFGLLTARQAYGRVRPSAVPLCGPGGDSRNHVRPGGKYSECDRPGHSWRCYTRRQVRAGAMGISEPGEALIWSLLAGLVWPPYLAARLSWRGLSQAITAGHKPLPAEVQARIAELEAGDDL